MTSLLTEDAPTADELMPMIRPVLFRPVLFRSGRAAITRTTIEGTPWLKLSLLSPDATVADITAVLELVRATGIGPFGLGLAALSDPCPGSTPSSSTSARSSAGTRA